MMRHIWISLLPFVILLQVKSALIGPAILQLHIGALWTQVLLL
eukprot:gene48154-62956_t